MADIQDWQRQSQSKNGGAQPAPHQMNPKTMAYGSSMNSKIAKPTHDCGGMVKSQGMANGGMVRGYADGGEVDDKAAGLAASANEKVGFFERMRMGNIDEEGSEAYNRFGAGRAKADRDMASEAAAMKAVDDARSAQTQTQAQDAREAQGDFIEAGSGVMNDTKPDAAKPEASKPAPKRAAFKPVVTRSVASKPAESAKKVTDTGDETSRLMARFPARAATKARVIAAPASSSSRVMTSVRPGEIDPKTLLPKR
jgi:hypothetical protein